MAVTITNVNRGTVAGDGTGDTAFVGVGKLNDNDNALQSAVEALQALSNEHIDWTNASTDFVTTGSGLFGDELIAANTILTTKLNFGLYGYSATLPALQFDSGDRIAYNRTTNSFAFDINSLPQLTLNATTADFQANAISTTGTITGNRFVVDPDQSFASTDGYMLGDGDTGFYETADDTIRVLNGGTNTWSISSSVLGSSTAGQPRMLRETASATNPTLLPSASDNNSGIGLAASGQLSLIANSIEALRLTESGGNITADFGAGDITTTGTGAFSSTTGGVGTGLTVGECEFFAFNSTTGLGNPTFRAATTNATTILRVIPNGTGLAAFEFFTTDYFSDTANWENIKIESGTTTKFYTQAGGTGTIRPLAIYTGANTTQLVLNTDGTVDVGGALGVTGTMAATTVTGANVTSGSDPGHTHTAYAASSHTHAFDSLTGKTSGTGNYATTGDLSAANIYGGIAGTIGTGVGSGSVAMTINDGQGNANLTFNHIDGVADFAGNVGRIAVNTDATSGATMIFDLKSNAATGAVTSTSYLTLSETALTMVGDVAGTTIGGITQANLVDKSATETISGAWTHSGEWLKTGLGANTAPATEGLRVGGYGIMGNRGTFYVSNNAGGIQLNYSGVHGASGKLLTTSIGVSVTGNLAASGKVTGTNVGHFDKHITIEAPTSGDDITWFFTNRAITVTEIRLVGVGTSVSSVITIRHSTDRSAVGTIVDANTVTSTTTGHDVTVISDATIPANSFVWIEVGTTTGTVTNVHVSMIGTID
jgi:hypothetical protein